MALSDLKLSEDYRSGSNNLLDDFFRPCLREADKYWRAVGYFSSSALEAFGSPLQEFIKKGGNIRLVTSVELHREDIDAIEQGLNKREICENRIQKIIDEQFNGFVGDGVSMLVSLLEIGRFEIKIATPKHGFGIYHEKVGLFFDNSDYVAFSGSTNESKTALEYNYECIDVYPSWLVSTRAERKRKHFESLWENEESGADVYDFPEALKKHLIRVCRESNNARKIKDLDDPKWRHQEEALKLFIEKKRGVLEMATGTGKTHTALKIVDFLISNNEIDSVIICTVGNDLLEQWYSSVLSFRAEVNAPIKIYRHFDNFKESQEFLLTQKDSILLISRYFLPSVINKISNSHANRTLLIHDEVHGLGSPSNREKLDGTSESFRYRLGLSATPEREYDAAGTKFINEHVGPVLFKFGLEKAIQRGILTPFNYYPLKYEITQEDRHKLASIYKRKAARQAQGNPMSDEEVWIAIAKVYKSSLAKLPIFDEFIANNQELLRRCIIFVETLEYGEEVLQCVHKYRSDFHTYFSGEQSDVLKSFAYGELECLITCYRLSEGIDIKSLTTVVLFSSSKARLKTIQRMGRCLRYDPVSPSKVANIVDFVRTSNDEDNPNSDVERCNWLTELSQIRPDYSYGT